MGYGVHRYVKLAISDAGTAANVNIRDWRDRVTRASPAQRDIGPTAQVSRSMSLSSRVERRAKVDTHGSGNTLDLVSAPGTNW